MKVRCVKSFTLKGVLYVSGDKYDMPVKTATEYAEYFKKMRTAPKNKSKKAEENK